jgi:hypothetical protein
MISLPDPLVHKDTIEFNVRSDVLGPPADPSLASVNDKRLEEIEHGAS